MTEQIYLDHNATTPCSEGAQEAMRPYFGGAFGNPSNTHWAGRAAKVGVDRARRQIAALFGATVEQVVATSGGTEADNLAIHGVIHTMREKGQHVVSTPLEHPAVLEPLEYLAELGVIELTLLAVDRHGDIDLAELAGVLRPDTVLVAIMAAHNELGVLYPVREIARLAHGVGAHYHCDGVQAAGKVPLAMEMGFDTLAVSAHKLYGPKGVGCLIVRDRGRLYPLLRGGGQEGGLRSGTENVPGLVGFGAAAAAATATLEAEGERLRALRELLYEGLRTAAPGIVRNSREQGCLPNTLHVSVPGLDAVAMLAELDGRGIAASAGSACHAGGGHTSALRHIGLAAGALHGTLRLSLGQSTTREAVHKVVEVFAEVLPRCWESA